MTQVKVMDNVEYPPLREAIVVIAILWVVTIFSQLDRQLPALLVTPIKAALDISDTQFSIIQGYAFAGAYALFGIPLGRMVDRANRRNLIIIGVIVWSIMTMASGMATTFEQLSFTRMGVGIGEAVLAPAAYSIIADYVHPSRRGKALAVYYVALAIGSGASLVIGGLILQAIPTTGIVVPILGALSDWQAAFVFAGMPGFALVILLLFIKEPVRREVGGGPTSSYLDFLRYIHKYRGAFYRIFSVATLLTIMGYGTLAWAPALFERKFGVDVATAGAWIGLTIGSMGLSGTLFSGWLSDKWLRSGNVGARFRVTMVATTILVLPAILWPIMPNTWLSIGMLAIAIFGLSMAQAAAPPSLQDIAPNEMRGQAITMYLLIASLLGIGFGPTSVALVTDYVFGDETLLHWALVAVSVPTASLALIAAWTGQKPYVACREARLSVK